MPLSDDAKNYALDQLADNRLLYLSAHDVDTPNSSGSGEISGGSYARVALTWDNASGGSINCSSTPIAINIPSGNTVRSVGYWTASSGGTFQGSANADDETFNADGVFNISDLDYDY